MKTTHQLPTPHRSRSLNAPEHLGLGPLQEGFVPTLADHFSHFGRAVQKFSGYRQSGS